MKRILFSIVAGMLLTASGYAINDQSLKSENTFGLLEDNFDLFFYPEYLPDFKGYEVYTNLHNTSGANRFQIGWFGLPDSVPGKLFLMFDTTRSRVSQDVFLPAAGWTPAWPTFLDPDIDFVGTGEQGFFNRAETEFFDDTLPPDDKSDRSIVRNASGESWTDSSEYEFLLGYGIPLNKQFSIGAGIGLGFNSGEARDSRSTFDLSYIETDLNTGTILENYADKADAKIEVGGSSFGFLLGGKFEPREKTKIGLDFSYSMLSNDGAGKYGSNSRNATWTRGVESASLSQSLSGAVGDPLVNGILDALPSDGMVFGVRLKTYFPLAKEHTLRFDASFENSTIDVKDGRRESAITTSASNSVTNVRTDGRTTDVVDYSGKNGSGNGFSILIADVMQATNLLQIAFGIGYERVQRTFDLKRNYTFNSVERIDSNNDGDAIDAPLDYDQISGLFDSRTTEERALSQSYKNEVTTNYIKLPIAAGVQLTKRLNLRLGAEHYIIINNTKESTSLTSGSLQTKTTYEDGTGVRTVTYTAFDVPDDTKTSSVDITSETDYRIGLGIEASKNMFIDLLANYYTNGDVDTHIHELSQEPHEATDILSLFASATIKF